MLQAGSKHTREMFAKLLVFFVIITETFANNPGLKIRQGSLKGVYKQTWKGKKISAFTGIPYARPPVGELRFKAPVKLDSWKGVLDATKSPSACPQTNVYLNNFHDVIGDEDCLYLNVYTPQLTRESKELFPVMLYIHGGGWICGSSKMYGAEILLDKNVVLVTFNYRLGPLGLLSTGDEVVPGNNALKDQSLAIKWTKENINHFGGDPDSITLFGQSAGGASTHLHLLSPLSKGLINNAISLSGTAVAQWSLSSNDECQQNSKKLAKQLNCPVNTSREMVDCLKQIDAYDMLKKDHTLYEWSYDPMIPFKPVIEPNLEGAFLTKHPLEIIKSGQAEDIPFMIGLTSEDGALKSASIYNNTKLVKELNKKFNKIAPLLFNFYNIVPDVEHTSKKIREFYLGDKEIDESTKDDVTKMITDGWFLLAATNAAELQFQYYKQPVYYYLFGYRGSTSFTKIYGDAEYDYGVCHCDELLYLFNFPEAPSFYTPNETDRKMADIMTTLLANFARTNNPTPWKEELITTKWTPVRSNKMEYFHIKNIDNLKMAEGLFFERGKFWQDLSITPGVNDILKDEL